MLPGVLLGLLFVPVDVSLEIERRSRFDVVVGFGWLFIHVRRKLELTSAATTNRRTRESRGRFPIPLRTLTEVGRVPGLWIGIGRFLRRLTSSLRIVEVSGRVRLGAGDAADTGRLWALIGPMTIWSRRWSRVDLAIEPDYSRACLTGTLGGTLRLYPARVAYAISAALCSPTAIRLLIVLLRSRRWKQQKPSRSSRARP